MPDPQTRQFTAQIPVLLAELENRASALFDLQLAPELAALPALVQLAESLRQMQEAFDARDRRINILLLGTYLGEMVRRETGGEWQVDAALGLPVILLPGGQRFSPMDAIRQRLTAAR